MRQENQYRSKMNDDILNTINETLLVKLKQFMLVPLIPMPPQ